MNSDMNNSRDRAKTETVPAALLEIHQRLLEDGATWRDELPLELARSAQAIRETEDPLPRAITEQNGRVAMRTKPPHMPRRDASLARPLIASAAIIVVVGLLAALFATFAHGKKDTRIAATATPGRIASWAAAPHLANEQVSPIIAPSDPSVIYEASVTGVNGAHIFRRSDNAGVTWHDLTVPNDILGAYTLGYLAAWVDPANAKNVMVTLSRGVPPEQNDRLCPTVRATVAFARQGAKIANAPTSGAGGCQLQYFSTDGGSHWLEMKFPVPGSITSGWSATQSTLNLLQSQGPRVFTAIHYRGQSGLVRIFVSQDRGETWNLADTGLYASDRNICDFVPAPDSTTLYATTGASECFQMITPQPITLWRSDDGGAQWSQVGQLPGTAGRVLTAFKAAGRANFTLYATAPDQNSLYGVQHAWASEDGGRTWNAVPDPGEVTNENAFLSEPHDGSLIIYNHSLYSILQPALATPTSTTAATSGSNAVKRWRPGEANWRPIAQPLGAANIFYIIESYSQNGAHSLWAVTGSSNAAHDGMAYSVYVAQLS